MVKDLLKAIHILENLQQAEHLRIWNVYGLQSTKIGDWQCKDWKLIWHQCHMYNISRIISCIFFNTCLYFSCYMAGYFSDRPHIRANFIRLLIPSTTQIGSSCRVEDSLTYCVSSMISFSSSVSSCSSHRNHSHHTNDVFPGIFFLSTIFPSFLWISYYQYEYVTNLCSLLMLLVPKAFICSII